MSENNSLANDLLLKQWRIKSIIALLMFVICSVLFVLNFSKYNDAFLGAITILGLCVAWFGFSHYHTKIAMHKIKTIADSYISELKAHKQRNNKP